MKKIIAGMAAGAAMMLAGMTGAMADGYTAPKKAAYHSHGCSWGGRFHGLVVGASVGYARHDADTLERELVGLSLFNDSEEGFAAGVSLGYNWQCGKMLFGIEADWTYTGVDRTRNYDIAGLLGGIPLAENHRSVDWVGMLRTKTGIVVEDRLMLYVVGGLAFGNVTNRVDIPLLGLLALNPTIINQDETRWGWTIGAGTEWAITDRISLKSEASYIRFQDADHTLQIGPAAINFTDRDSMWISRVGLNFKLHGEHYAAPLK